ncbi:suppressor of swi4 1 [Anaeramoeba flamelloides]|uniref:Suppressor of swi4 1 n=1 Tax=Anaeramoeba flamelloides TaxID=1746091 RepID=A0AAV7ZC18_9EUKA|nr:suppressor of swi4 1 [Anaeramoeba flamelloides]
MKATFQDLIDSGEYSLPSGVSSNKLSLEKACTSPLHILFVHSGKQKVSTLTRHKPTSSQTTTKTTKTTSKRNNGCLNYKTKNRVVEIFFQKFAIQKENKKKKKPSHKEKQKQKQRLQKKLFAIVIENTGVLKAWSWSTEEWAWKSAGEINLISEEIQGEITWARRTIGVTNNHFVWVIKNKSNEKKALLSATLFPDSESKMGLQNTKVLTKKIKANSKLYAGFEGVWHFPPIVNSSQRNSRDETSFIYHPINNNKQSPISISLNHIFKNNKKITLINKAFIKIKITDEFGFTNKSILLLHKETGTILRLWDSIKGRPTDSSFLKDSNSFHSISYESNTNLHKPKNNLSTTSSLNLSSSSSSSSSLSSALSIEDNRICGIEILSTINDPRISEKKKKNTNKWNDIECAFIHYQNVGIIRSRNEGPADCSFFDLPTGIFLFPIPMPQYFKRNQTINLQNKIWRSIPSIKCKTIFWDKNLSKVPSNDKNKKNRKNKKNSENDKDKDKDKDKGNEKDKKNEMGDNFNSALVSLSMNSILEQLIRFAQTKLGSLRASEISNQWGMYRWTVKFLFDALNEMQPSENGIKRRNIVKMISEITSTPALVLSFLSELQSYDLLNEIVSDFIEQISTYSTELFQKASPFNSKLLPYLKEFIQIIPQNRKKSKGFEKETDFILNNKMRSKSNINKKQQIGNQRKNETSGSRQKDDYYNDDDDNDNDDDDNEFNEFNENFKIKTKKNKNIKNLKRSDLEFMMITEPKSLLNMLKTGLELEQIDISIGRLIYEFGEMNQLSFNNNLSRNKREQSRGSESNSVKINRNESPAYFSMMCRLMYLFDSKNLISFVKQFINEKQSKSKIGAIIEECILSIPLLSQKEPTLDQINARAELFFILNCPIEAIKLYITYEHWERAFNMITNSNIDKKDDHDKDERKKEKLHTFSEEERASFWVILFKAALKKNKKALIQKLMKNKPKIYNSLEIISMIHEIESEINLTEKEKNLPIFLDKEDNLSLGDIIQN